jgi:Tfp pilus assembly protein PilN
MIRINLLSEGRRPVVARRAKARFDFGGQDPSVVFLATGLLLGLAAAGIWWWLVNAERQDLRERVARAQAEVEELRPIIEEVEAFKAKRTSLTAKIDVIEDLKRKQTGPVYLMDQVSRTLPDLVWLTDMKVTSDRVELSGEAFNTNGVAAYIANLDRVPEFGEPEPGNLLAGSNTDRYTFKISFPYDLSPPVQEEAVEGDAAMDVEGAVP